LREHRLARGLPFLRRHHRGCVEAEDLALLGIGCHGSLLFVLAPAARSPAARVRSLTRKASRFDRPVRVTNVSGFLSDRPTAHDRYAPSRAPDAAQRFFSGALLIR